MLELQVDQPIFIGFKADSSLRLHLGSLNASDKQYISGENSTYLRTCKMGEDLYVGKLIHESLTTDRVEDIRLNVLSILRKIGHAVRLPSNLKILACSAVESADRPLQIRTPSHDGLR